MEKIRKEIHLPSHMIKDLRIIAAQSDKSPKKYIEDLIVREVQMQIIKINNNKLP